MYTYIYALIDALFAAVSEINGNRRPSLPCGAYTCMRIERRGHVLYLPRAVRRRIRHDMVFEDDHDVFKATANIGCISLKEKLCGRSYVMH